MIYRDTHTHGCVGGWLGGSVGQWVGSGQIINYRINLDLIRIIQLCLVHDLVGVWVGGWVDGWDQVKSLKFNKC